MLTLNELTEAMPPQLKKAATEELLDKVNQASLDPEVAKTIRENFITYGSVLKDGRFKIDDFLNACTYVSYKMMEYTNQDAYAKAFPQRYQLLVAAGRSKKEISAYVANYNKNKLVNLVMEQAIIPAWILNRGVYQQAIDTQLELMMTAGSEKVRTEAANSILTHLKQPETKKIEIDIGMKDNSGMAELRETMAELARKQIDMIKGGTKTQEIAHQKMVRPIDEDLIDITPNQTTP